MIRYQIKSVGYEMGLLSLVLVTVRSLLLSVPKLITVESGQKN